MAAGAHALRVMLGLAAVKEGGGEARLTNLVRDDDEHTITVYLPGTLSDEEVKAVAPLIAQVYEAGRHDGRLVGRERAHARPYRTLPMLEPDPDLELPFEAVDAHPG